MRSFGIYIIKMIIALTFCCFITSTINKQLLSETLNVKTDVLVLGDSRAMGLHAENWTNFSYPGAPKKLNLIYLRRIIENSAIKPSVVILNYAIGDLTYGISDHRFSENANGWFNSNAGKLSFLLYPREILPLRLRARDKFRLFLGMFKIHFWKDYTTATNGGWHRNSLLQDKKFNLKVSSIDEFNRMQPAPIPSKFQVNAVNEIIRLCRLIGAELILVETPLHPELLQLFAEDYSHIHDSIINELCSHKHVHNISPVRRFDELSPMDWWDEAHLNQEGLKPVIQEIQDYLKIHEFVPLQ